MRRVLAAVLLASMAGVGPLPAWAQSPGDARQVAALIGLARTARDQGRVAEAARLFNDADRLAPFDLTLLTEFFWTAHRAGVPDAAAIGVRILAASPHDRGVREGLIGLAADARDESRVRGLIREGMKLAPGAAIWPRRLGQSHLRSGDFRAAAAAFQSAAMLEGGDRADRAQAAMALEMSGDARGSASAWAHIDKAFASSRPEWAESRRRALAPPPPAPEPNRVRTSEELAAEATRALTTAPCAVVPLGTLAGLENGEPFIAAVERRPRTCADYEGWTSRAVERAIAVEAFERALALARSGGEPRGLALREQTGVLLHWTGRHDQAEPMLAGVVSEDAGRTRARTALIEARRAVGDADGAWDAAQFFRNGETSAASRLLLAELALETGRATDALDLARALEGSTPDERRRRAVLGSALLAMGRASEARPVLETLVPSPGPSLAWLDAVASLDGVAQALCESAQLPVEPTAEWVDVVARRVVWHHELGQRAAAEREMATLRSVDAVRARLAGAEAALATGRPADAEVALRAVLALRHEDLRALDGLSTALAEQGRWDEAFDTLSALRTRRPHETRWAIREAEWRHRQSPAPGSLRALEALAGVAPAAEARSALARAYVRAGQFDRAIDVLGPERSGLAEHDLLLVARSLRAADRGAEALALLETRSSWPLAGLLLRAELVAANRGASAADATFVGLVSLPEAQPEWYLAWAAAQDRASVRLSVLEQGAKRFSHDARLQEQLAVTAWAERRRDLAGRAAAAALAADETRTPAWFVAVELGRSELEPSALVDLLDRFEARFRDEPSTRIGMAEMLAGLTTRAGDPAARRALGWMEEILAREPGHVRAAMAGARLLAAMGRVDEAIAGVAALAAARPGLPAPLELGAELLAAAGRHADAVDAYDRYLAVAPGDVKARRQQARIEGWRGAYGRSLSRYHALLDVAPGPAVEAEAGAKAAFYGGRWHEALARYSTWLSLEPGDVEAALERAQVYDRLGEPVRARDAFRAVAAAVASNDVALTAADRIERRRESAVDLFAHAQAADAPARQQLLSLLDAGAAVSDDFGRGYGTRARLSGGASFADVGDRVWRGHHVGGEFSSRVAAPLTVRGQIGYRALANVPAQWTGAAGLAWRPRSTLRIGGVLERSPLLENAATLLAGVHGAGPAADMRWTPTADFVLAASAGGSWLNDGNLRRSLRMDASQRLRRGSSEVKAIVVAEFLSYTERRDSYFTPRAFWRHDLGAEWRGWLVPPRFFGDRERWLSAAYLIGFDDRGERYHTGRLGASYEVASGLSVVAEGHVVRSRVFRGGRFTLGLRLKHVALPEP